jgi:flagellar protein FlgJ
MDAGIQSMMSLAQQQPLAKAPGRVGASQSGTQMNSTGSIAAADKSSKEYEQVFISQFLGSMFSGISADGVTGGGEGEEMFRSMMVDQYAKGIEGQGGFGIAAQMKAELLKHQQVALPQAAAQ